MGPRSQETSLQVARPQHLALPQGDVTEVVACRTAFLALEGIQLTVIDKPPLLHGSSAAVHQYYLSSCGIGNGVHCHYSRVNLLIRY